MGMLSFSKEHLMKCLLLFFTIFTFQSEQNNMLVQIFDIGNQDGGMFGRCYVSDSVVTSSCSPNYCKILPVLLYYSLQGGQI